MTRGRVCLKIIELLDRRTSVRSEDGEEFLLHCRNQKQFEIWELTCCSCWRSFLLSGRETKSKIREGTGWNANVITTSGYNIFPGRALIMSKLKGRCCDVRGNYSPRNIIKMSLSLVVAIMNIVFRLHFTLAKYYIITSNTDKNRNLILRNTELRSDEFFKYFHSANIFHSVSIITANFIWRLPHILYH